MSELQSCLKCPTYQTEIKKLNPQTINQQPVLFKLEVQFGVQFACLEGLDGMPCILINHSKLTHSR
jgi:hypothetical protein